MEQQLKSIKQLTKEKWINLYKFNYGNRNYLVASRNTKEKLVAVSNTVRPDAVRVLPYFTQKGKIFVVFIKEFRSPLNKYIYGLPAGLVDGDEAPKTAAIRELEEEIGAKTISIKPTSGVVYTSAGLTDESVQTFEAKVKLTSVQHLEPTEDISIEIVELSDMPAFLNNHEFCMCSLLMAQAFYWQHKPTNSVK